MIRTLRQWELYYEEYGAIIVTMSLLDNYIMYLMWDVIIHFASLTVMMLQVNR